MSVDYMVIHNVELDDEQWGSFTVYAEALQFHMYDTTVSKLSVDDFFFLACDYLEMYERGVVSTDAAKIDYYRLMG